VLVVDDHAEMAQTIAEGLDERGYDATAMSSSRDAVRALSERSFDALITDLRMPDVDGLGLLAHSRRTAPDRPVIVVTAYSAVDTAVESIRQGAYHYLTKPFKMEELALFLERALDEVKVRREAIALRRSLREQAGLPGLVGASAAMREVKDLVTRVADADVPVLITGETGTGKGIVARAVHSHGARAGGPFVAVNCAALPENLLESELFGHVKGAFTGATSSREGLIEEASGGTLFLDEIGEMSPALQAKLLHVLESRTVRAIGANRERSVDTRILAATHRDLRGRVASGAFREDLLYRLDVVTIELPPLRLRRDDLPDLLEHFLARARSKHPRSPVERIGRDALDRLLEHDWPGNVRELEHVVERVVLLGQAVEVNAADLPATVGARREGELAFRGPVVPMRELQRRYAGWAYEQLGGRKAATAERLQVDVKTLGKWLRAGGEDEG
jgi:two-component system response regulator HydG